MAKADDRVQRVMQIPGVGRVTAEAIVTAVDDAKRFKNGRQVSAYAGLVPRQYQSGETDRRGRITKRGSRLLRIPARRDWLNAPGALRNTTRGLELPTSGFMAASESVARRRRSRWQGESSSSPGPCCVTTLTTIQRNCYSSKRRNPSTQFTLTSMIHSNEDTKPHATYRRILNEVNRSNTSSSETCHNECERGVFTNGGKPYGILRPANQ